VRGRVALHAPGARWRRGLAAAVALGFNLLLYLLLVPRLPDGGPARMREAVPLRLVAARPQPVARVESRAAQPAVRRLAPRPPPALDEAPGGPGGEPAAADASAPPLAPAPLPAPPRLNLALPGRDRRGPASPALDTRSAALNDPRANSARPRFEERLSLATGTAECVLATRKPDGSVHRRFGRLVYLETLHAAATNVKDLVPVCVE